jgi:hypothetical protein
MAQPRNLDIHTLCAVAPAVAPRSRPAKLGLLKRGAQRWLPAWGLPRHQRGGIAVDAQNEVVKPFQSAPADEGGRCSSSILCCA